MAVTDLTGTSWYLNKLIPTQTSVDFNSLNFTADFGTRNYTRFRVYNQSLRYYYSGTYYDEVYRTATWQQTGYRTIHITGGSQVKNQTAINWFTTNATQILPKVTITYSTAHGTAPSSKEVDAGYALTSADLPTLSATGWRFTGWNKAVGYVVNENTTITASWIQQRTITYSTEHGTAPSSKTVDTGYALTQDDLPTLADVNKWQFLGWDKSVGYVVNADTTITASWLLKPEPKIEPEIDWHGNRSDEQFIFRKVSWDNWQEHDSYNYITRGSIEYATDAELKVTSSFNFEGFEIPDTNDLIRVYYKFSDGNVAKENPIATLFVSYATINFIETVSGMKASGQLNGLSVLSVLKNKKIGRPYTIKRGTNVVYAAEDLVKECGLLVNTEPTVFVLKSDYTFDSEASYLDIVNFLLSAAGYVGAYPDENGVVQFRKMNSEAGRKIEFINNEKSIMYPEISQENDWQNTPNVVKLLYNTDEACVVAYANNVSGSRASLSNRGNREITYVDEVSDVGEGSVATLLKQKAEELLKEKSCDIEYVKFRHAFVPMMLYDSTTIKYGDREWSGTMDNFSVDLSPAVETTSKVKRSLQQDIVISSGSTIYRGA